MLKINFFDNLETKKFILSLFGDSVDNNNFIVDGSGEKVIDSDGQEISIDQLGAIKNGSQIYVKKNIVSLVGFYRKHLQK